MMNTSQTKQPEQFIHHPTQKQTHLISSHTRSYQISCKVNVCSMAGGRISWQTQWRIFHKLPNEQNQTSTEDQIQTPPQNDLKK